MIKVKGLSKAFGPIVAADRVSFSAAKGDVLGFLGPNGASIGVYRMFPERQVRLVGPFLHSVGDTMANLLSVAS